VTERGYRNEAATEIAERCWAAPFSPASFLPGIPADQNRKCSANFSVPRTYIQFCSRQIWGGGRSCLGFPVRGVLLYQSLKMIKKRTPHGKFSIYPAHPFLICTVQYCPRFHFPEFDGWSKAWSSTRHGAWALENTRRRPPFVPSSCLYDPCIGQHQTAHVRAHKPPPRGGWRHKA